MTLLDSTASVADLAAGASRTAALLRVHVGSVAPAGRLFDLRDAKVTRFEDFGSKEHALDAAGVPG